MGNYLGSISGCLVWIFLIVGCIYSDEPWVTPIAAVIGTLVLIAGFVSGGGARSNDEQD